MKLTTITLTITLAISFISSTARAHHDETEFETKDHLAIASVSFFGTLIIGNMTLGDHQQTRDNDATPELPRPRIEFSPTINFDSATDSFSHGIRHTIPSDW